jgi:hypothetical protein
MPRHERAEPRSSPLFQRRQTERRTSQRARHVKTVSGTGAAAEQDTRAGFADQGHVHDQAVGGVGVAADDDGARLVAGLSEAVKKPLRVPPPGFAGQSHRHEGKSRIPSHGGDVREVHAHRLETDLFGLHPVASEVNTFNQEIGRQDDVAAAHAHHRGVVARPDGYAFFGITEM